MFYLAFVEPFANLACFMDIKLLQFLPRSCTLLHSNEKEDWQGSASEKITENHFLIFIYFFFFCLNR